MSHESRDHLHNVSAGHGRLDHVKRVMNSTRDPERCFNASCQYRRSSKSQIQISRARELHSAQDFELDYVKVDLMKTREENYRISAGRIELQRKVGEGGKQRRDFYRDRNIDRSFDRPNCLKQLSLDFGRT